MSIETNGEVIDSMSILDIINHRHFYKLKVFNGFGGSQDYWEVTFDTDDVGINGLPLTIFGYETPQNRYKFYKIKL